MLSDLLRMYRARYALSRSSAIALQPAPKSIAPATGPTSGGTSVTIRGNHLAGASAVTFAGVAATAVQPVDDGSVICTTPAGAPGTNADVAVTTRAGVGVLAAAFAYAAAAPTVASCAPNLGDTAGGGQLVTITGTNFTGATGVTFGGNAASNVTVVNDTTITCTPPAHASGLVNVAVTAPGGTGTGANVFEFWTPAQIAGVDTYLDANKGIIYGAGFLVAQWTGQDSNALAWAQAVGAQQPTQVANVFGALPSIRFAGNQWLDLAAGRAFATGLSWFFIGKTSTNFLNAGGVFDAPGNVIGRDDGSAWGGFGFDTGASAAMYYTMFDNGGSTSPHTIRGTPPLNDGSVRMYGVTSDTTPTRKLYIGATQQGASDSPAGGYDTVNTTYKTIGAGFGDAEQFTGDLAAIVAVVGVISGGDLAKLNTWSQQRWGTP